MESTTSTPTHQLSNSLPFEFFSQLLQFTDRQWRYIRWTLSRHFWQENWTKKFTWSNPRDSGLAQKKRIFCLPTSEKLVRIEASPMCLESKDTTLPRIDRLRANALGSPRLHQQGNRRHH